jgi:Ankyrin repeats (3 copies)
MTLGLHYYKGMIVGLAIQTVMAPLNLAENALVKALITSNILGGNAGDRWFDEKTLQELSPNDEVVDEAGNPVDRSMLTNESSTATNNSNNKKSPQQSLQDLLLDTWDAGASANIDVLLKSLDKKTCNTATADDRWTPLMILAGLGAPGTGPAISTLLEWGADPSQTDVEGWTPLHWAAFHGNVESAKVLCSRVDLLKVADKEGLTPIETARKEGNDEVAIVYEAAMGESKKSK